MEFKKIQLNGFKSFADKTIFLIENGLTGIVGPNGCGKSNIVESLRWCMGETSAKSMRGSGMEDVIFSGTSNKPSKNIAEVSISLSNFSKDLRQRKGQGTFKLAIRLFIKRSTNFILRKLKLKKLLAKKNESNFFDYEALKIFLKENKILYEIESIKKIEEIFLQK